MSVFSVGLGVAWSVCLVFAWPVLAQAATADTPESAIWEYMDDQYARASQAEDFWQKRWHIESEPVRSELRLGRPFAAYRLIEARHYERFVQTGDLLGSAVLVYHSYPLFDGKDLIGTVQVVEQDGQWSFAGRHEVGGQADSLAVSYSAECDSVFLVGGKGIGGVIVARRRGQAEFVVVPLGNHSGAILAPGRGRDGVIPYATACTLLRPEAERFLLRLREAEKEE